MSLLKDRSSRLAKLALALLAATLVFQITIPTSAFSYAKTEIGPVTNTEETPKAFIVVDAESGAIVSKKNMHDPLNVASTSKILTALAAVNTLSPDQLIEIPKEAETVQPMKIGMKQGEKWKRDDLIYSLLLVSANDAAYALANASAGSIEDFVKQQNRIAKELSMKDSVFGDPSGLDDELAINGDTKMSAYDLAIAGRATLAQPDLSKIVRTVNYQFMGGDNVMHTLTNHNDEFLNNYSGANGLKTGYTRRSGRTLMVSATREGRTLIAVVLGVQQTNEWAAQLLNEGFNAIKTGSVPKNAEKLPTIGVIGSKGNVTILNEPKSENGPSSVSNNENKSQKGNPLISFPVVTFAILLTLAVLFIWRRRVVAKRKKLRRQRALAAREAGRRQMIDVIDLTIEQESELVSKR